MHTTSGDVVEVNLYEEMQRMLPELRATLSSFAASAENFRLPFSALSADSRAAPPLGSSTTLHILDSSFNPPTLAHLHLALSSVSTTSQIRLLLLLATQNADKAAAPAAFNERLAMMRLFGNSISASNPAVTVDIGITKHARFLDKSAVLAEHYGPLGITEQVYLTGYDTLIRLLDTKYYPDAHTLDPLAEFFEMNKVRCMMRVGDKWGADAEQYEYVERIRKGERESDGCKKAWAEKIELVENTLTKSGLGPVSSTVVREAVKMRDEQALDTLLTPEVKKWVSERNLYTEE